MFGLSQLIDCPTRLTSNTFSLIDHILTNSQVNISQLSITDTAISDHSLTYIVLEKSRKRNKEKTFRFLKNYLANVYKGKLEKV